MSTVPKIIVVSHERSGTHFLMNTLGYAFGYEKQKFVNFDHPTARINFYDPPTVARFFSRIPATYASYPVKSHHPFGFFADVIDHILPNYLVLYIYRNPKDVMKSFRRFLHNWRWFEGPKVNTDKEFIRAQPCGQMLRYQLFQRENLLKRWASHVAGWHEAASTRSRIVLVRYEELNEAYPKTIDALGERLGVAPRTSDKPPRDQAVIPSIPATHPAYDGGGYDDEDENFFQSQVGDLLTQLGY